MILCWFFCCDAIAVKYIPLITSFAEKWLCWLLRSSAASCRVVHIISWSPRLVLHSSLFCADFKTRLFLSVRSASRHNWLPSTRGFNRAPFQSPAPPIICILCITPGNLVYNSRVLKNTCPRKSSHSSLSDWSGTQRGVLLCESRRPRQGCAQRLQLCLRSSFQFVCLFGYFCS